MKLNSVKLKFEWSPAAQSAFCNLKTLFSSADSPQPRSTVHSGGDASDSGVRPVLSQRSPTGQRLHPCAFYSQWLTPAERNYDVGNRELLAVVLAL